MGRRRVKGAADLLAKAEREETVAAIRAGLADVDTGRTRPARAALKSLARRYRLLMAGN